MSRNSVPIIPSLNPGTDLVSYVTSLVTNGFQKIMLADDESADAQAELRAIPQLPSSVAAYAVREAV